jgi:DNA-binding response OmpR family regulator
MTTRRGPEDGPCYSPQADGRPDCDGQLLKTSLRRTCYRRISAMDILIVEDNRRLAANLRRYLELEGYSADVAHDGVEGLEKAIATAPDCLILDLNLPRLDGLAVCERLRDRGVPVPILMLTARSATQDVVQGLDTGADDYLVKPFEMEELLARVRTLLRRPIADRGPVLRAGEVVVDTNTHEVRKRGQVVHLAPREYDLLEYLLRNRGVAHDRLKLIEDVWGEYDDLLFSQTVDVHVAYLRRKLGKDLITTVPGKGYLISG